jgi:hypothetical protein
MGRGGGEYRNQYKPGGGSGGFSSTIPLETVRRLVKRMRAKIVRLMMKVRDLKEIRTLTIRYDESGLGREVDRRIKECEGELRVLETRLKCGQTKS